MDIQPADVSVNMEVAVDGGDVAYRVRRKGAPNRLVMGRPTAVLADHVELAGALGGADHLPRLLH
jgi:hypothetical protein